MDSVDPRGRLRTIYYLKDEKGVRQIVCHRFFADVYGRSNSISRSALECAGRERSSPQALAVRVWLHDIQQYHEFAPDTVGAGSAVPLAASAESDQKEESRSDLIAAPPKQRSTGVQLPYPTRQEVYLHFVRDYLEGVGRESGISGPKKKQSPSLSTFKRIWQIHFPHLHLRRHMRFSKCGICIYWRSKIGAPELRDHAKRATYRQCFWEHLAATRAEREYYHTKRNLASRPDSEWLSIIFDGADQSAYGFPYFWEKSKDSDGVFKQKYHLIGVLVHGIGSWVYTMSHRFKADSNVTIEVLQRVLQEIEAKKGKLPKKLYLQMDNCVRENKNKYVLGYLSWLVQRGVFEEIELSFLPVGHTHEDIDQMFSRIAIHLRGRDAHHQFQMHDAVHGAYQSCSGVRPVCAEIDAVANISSWITPYLNEIHNHAGRNILHYQFLPHADGAMIHSKKRADHKWDLYDTPSGGFHLLTVGGLAGIPTVVDGEWSTALNVPDLQPNVTRHIEKIRRGLAALASEPRITSASLVILEANIALLEDPNPVPFAWPAQGLFLREREPNGALVPVRESQREELEAMVELTRKAEADRCTLMGVDDDQDLDLPDDNFGALRTGPQDKALKEAKRLAKAAKQDSVKSLKRGHFIVIRRGDDEPAEKREFFVGKVLHIQRENVSKYQLGDIEFQWYTPYNAARGKPLSKRIGDVFTGRYVADVTTGGRESEERAGSNYNWASGKILWYFTRLTDAGTLPAHVVARIKAHFDQSKPFPPLSLDDAVLLPADDGEDEEAQDDDQEEDEDEEAQDDDQEEDEDEEAQDDDQEAMPRKSRKRRNSRAQRESAVPTSSATCQKRRRN
jgi:hypothetical protein